MKLPAQAVIKGKLRLVSKQPALRRGLADAIRVWQAAERTDPCPWQDHRIGFPLAMNYDQGSEPGGYGPATLPAPLAHTMAMARPRSLMRDLPFGIASSTLPSIHSFERFGYG